MRTTTIRKAGANDIPAIRDLQERSLREIGGNHYTPDEIALFIDRFGTMDFDILDEGHFFLALDEGGRPVGTGGWSRRLPGYQRAGTVADSSASATVRGVFVDPSATRRGIGSAIMRHVEADAASQGVPALKLTATLSGVALYAALGYRERARRAIDLGSGCGFGCVDMEKQLHVAERGGLAAPAIAFGGLSSVVYLLHLWLTSMPIVDLRL